MVKGKPRSGTGNARRGTYGNAVFIEPYLTAEHKRELKQLIADDTWGMDDIFELVDQGYKFSIKFTEKNSMFACTLSQQEGEKTLVLNGRGATPINAIYALLYRFYQLLGGALREEDDDGTPTDFA